MPNERAESARRSEPLGDRPILELASDAVNLWIFPALAASEADYQRCFALLSPEEQQRALRIRAGHARDEAICGRAVLRVLLGAVLRASPRALRLAVGQNGKPAVEGLRFNVSHSRGRVLIGISRETELGVDLEWVERTQNPEEISAAYFTAGEQQLLAGAEDQPAVFYRLWTCKEAILKALGCGLSEPLDSFSVPQPGDPVFLRGTPVWVQPLPLEKGWACALATLGPTPPVTLRHVGADTLRRWIAGAVE